MSSKTRTSLKEFINKTSNIDSKVKDIYENDITIKGDLDLSGRLNVMSNLSVQGQNLNMNGGDILGANIETDQFNSSNGFTFYKTEESGSNLALAHIHKDGMFVGGNLHINIDFPKHTFDLVGDMRVSENATFLKTVTAQEVTATSDRRLKYDIEKISNSLAKLEMINGYNFKFLSDKDEDKKEDKKRCGLIAQEVMETIPEAVTRNDDGYLSLSYGSLMGVLVNAIKEMKMILDDQNEKINKLSKI